MEMRALGGTGVTTSALGFGSGGLFGLPLRRERRVLLERAYELGIRHFDAAPIYGLGRAESELGPFLRGRRESVTVTTKFGLAPTTVGRTAGLVQSPVRVALARAPGLDRGLKSSGRGADTGTVGRLLYRQDEYSAETARRGLEASLRALGTDYVDVFALHEPLTRPIPDHAALVSRLDSEVHAGRIRAWGVAGDLDPLHETGKQVLECAQVAQYPDDLLMGERPESRYPRHINVTFGALSRVLPGVRALRARELSKFRRWGERLGRDLADDKEIVGLLLRGALRRNPGGVVLCSTTKVRNLEVLVNAAMTTPHTDEDAVLEELRRHLEGHPE